MKLRSGLLSVFAFLLLLGATSCTKDFICECEIVYSGQPGLPDTLINEYKITNTKKEAQSICEEGSSENMEDGIKTVETCKLY